MTFFLEKPAAGRKPAVNLQIIRPRLKDIYLPANCQSLSRINGNLGAVPHSQNDGSNRPQGSLQRFATGAGFRSAWQGL